MDIKPSRFSSFLRSVAPIAVVTASLLGQSPALATPAITEAPTTCTASNDAPLDIKPTPAETPAAVRQALMFIDSGAANVHSDELRTEDATAYTVSTEGNTLNAVTIPVVGEFSYTSNLTFLTDKNGKLVRYSEALVDESSQGTFRIRVFNDGHLTKDEQTDLEFMGDDEMRAASTVDPNDPSTTTYGVGGTVACLATVAGIGGPAAYVVASMCAGSCVAAETGVGAAICAACIGGYATLGAGGMAAAASYF